VLKWAPSARDFLGKHPAIVQARADGWLCRSRLTTPTRPRLNHYSTTLRRA
jgi:hypothetical protein